MTETWKCRLTALARSHIAAALLGLVIAHGIWWRIAPGMQRVVDGITRWPLGQAAQLAFRFGSEQHARAVLNHLKVAPRDDVLGPLDDMVIELRLGALAGEHETVGVPTPHLDTAQRFCAEAAQTLARPPTCEPTRLHARMAKLAEQRLVRRER